MHIWASTIKMEWAYIDGGVCTGL